MKNSGPGNQIMTTPIYEAMNRPSLFMGGDREIMLVTLLIVFTLTFISLKPWVAIFALVFSSITIKVLRVMAKADPNMRKVYLRHRRYKAYYKAASTPFIKEAK